MYNKSMLISAKSNYALRVLTEMASGKEGEFFCVGKLSDELSISRKYLESIMTLLAKNNLLEVSLGKNGGYRLNRSPDEYKLIDILNVTEKDLAPVTCLENNCEPCEKADSCPALSTWSGLHDLIIDYFTNKTLLDLMNNNECKK